MTRKLTFAFTLGLVLGFGLGHAHADIIDHTGRDPAGDAQYAKSQYAKRFDDCMTQQRIALGITRMLVKEDWERLEKKYGAEAFRKMVDDKMVNDCVKEAGGDNENGTDAE